MLEGLVQKRPMTLTQKILRHHALDWPSTSVETGDILRIRVDWTISSELAWNGMNATYERLGRPALANGDRFYLALDHTVDPKTLAGDRRTQKLVQLSRDFAKEARLSHFYDANETIMHTKFYRDLVQPGQVVIGADSHTSSHGGVGAVAIGLGGADVCIAMVLGETWIQVPEAIQVVYNGRLPFGLTGKDVILKTLGDLGRNTTAMERSVEYVGDALEDFSTDFRFTVANMTAEFGGLNGIFPADRATAALLAGRHSDNRDALYFRADEDASYAARHVFDLASMVPQIAKPFSPDNVRNVSEVTGQAMDGMFIGACTTTEEELILGAMVLRKALAGGSPVAALDKRLMVPGSREIAENLRAKGLLAVYEQAGFRIGASGCSMCLGIASDKAGPGENWLSSQNRNFENRMGQGSIAWLASAPTVAASSLTMRVTDPRALLESLSPEEFRSYLKPVGPLPSITITEPAAVVALQQAARAESVASTNAIEGRAQLFGDNVDTDAMIPGEFCHLTEPSEIAGAAFRFVRPDFVARIRAGEDIVVAGEGWGTGSSRENAAWALKYAGVRAVIAKSIAYIHKRNLVNEAIPFFLVHDDAFYAAVHDGDPISIAGDAIRAAGREFHAAAVSPIAQRIQAAGGVVAAVQRDGKSAFAA